MAIDTASPRTRRALLAAALGAGAASVAAALRPLSADAATGDPVILGSSSNVANGYTTIGNSGDPDTIARFAAGFTYGVLGTTGTQTGWGVIGHNYAAGGISVYGEVVSSTLYNSVGVAGKTAGHSSQIGVRGIADPEGIGVHGKTANGVGVRGEAPGGWGVHGSSANRGVFGETTSGVGVYGSATTGIAMHASTPVSNGLHTGYALRASGKIKLDNCAGVATIASGTKSVVVTPGINLTSSSAVVASLMGSAGGTTTVHRSVVNATANTFTIYLTANSTANVKVAWHVFG